MARNNEDRYENKLTQALNAATYADLQAALEKANRAYIRLQYSRQLIAEVAR